jgi:hypothetical protein
MTAQEQLIERVKQMTDEEAQKLLSDLDAQNQPRLSLSDVIDEILADILPEELEHLPTDMAEQHDHYAYGVPKK